MRTAKISVLVFCFALCGCSAVDYFKPEKPPYDYELASSYRQTVLRVSSSADVFGTIHRPDYEDLSQSKSVIGSLGQKKKGHEIWFNIVAFDENTLTAQRKYFFVVDEKPKAISLSPKRSLVFDSEMVLPVEFLAEPYTNENARRIAMLNYIQDKMRGDVAELEPDNKMFGICGAIINQTLATVLLKLDESPVLASGLDGTEGVRFDHITLGKGTIRLRVVGGTAIMNIKIGSLTYRFEEPPPEIDQDI